jgi:ABC-2 type transport system ATP-binding protein
MLVAEKLAKSYGPVHALQALDLEIRPGEIVALLGTNGAGKTTTVKLFLGLIRPSAGRVSIDGLPAGDMGLRGRIGYCPESPRVHEFLTVEQTLRYYAELGGLPRGRRAAEVDRVMRLTEIEDLRRRKSGALSKGQSQRVALAQSLLGDPPLLLLDEPTSGLDPLGRIAVRKLIQGCRSEGKTVLVNSHMLSEVERLCDRAVILRQGRKVWDDRIEAILARQVTLENLFLELNQGDGHAAHCPHDAA